MHQQTSLANLNHGNGKHDHGPVASHEADVALSSEHTRGLSGEACFIDDAVARMR